MNWEEVACLDFAANYHERMFLESWYTKSDDNSINICRDMPGAYYSLYNNTRSFCIFIGRELCVIKVHTHGWRQLMAWSN